MILILKTGSTLESFIAQHGDFEHWIADKLELSESAYRVHNAGNYNSLPPDIGYSGG